VTRASTVSKKADDEGERTNATVAGLAASAQKIGEVVALINDIASQTTIEDEISFTSRMVLEMPWMASTAQVAAIQAETRSARRHCG
jgi:hypothetical protein